jgi:hypothetical protein
VSYDAMHGPAATKYADGAVNFAGDDTSTATQFAEDDASAWNALAMSVGEDSRSAAVRYHL